MEKRAVERRATIFIRKRSRIYRGDYLPDIPLVIDPAMTWSTFLGGNGDDTCDGIAVDGAGNVYVTGYTESTWGNPKTPIPAAK